VVVKRPGLDADHSNSVLPQLRIGGGTPSLPLLACTRATLPLVSVGSIVWSTALQTGRSRDRFSMVSFEFFIDIILPVALMTLGSTQPLTEMSTRNISWW
jgi:hypothetical protein